MAPSLKPLLVLTTVILSNSVALTSTIDLVCNRQEYCLNSPINYQCIVSQPANTLTWTIRNKNMMTIGIKSYSTGDDLDTFRSLPNAPSFSTDLSSTTPSIVSNISFTVQSSINGYTIICDTRNCTINIPDPPPPPDDIGIHLTDHIIYINWTVVPSQCFDSYTVNTTSTIISTTDTSITIPLAGLSPGIYCVSVASVDTANRTGTYSEEKCLLLNVPTAPNVTRVINDNNVLTVFINFIIDASTPSLSAVYISNNQSGLTTLPASQTTFNIPLEYGVVYNITIYGENVLGVGLATSFTTSLDTPPHMSVTPTMSNTVPPSNEQDNNTIVAVSVSIVLVFIFLIVAAICVYILACAVKTKRSVSYTVSKRTMNSFIVDVRNAAFSPCNDLRATAPHGQMKPEEYYRDGAVNNVEAKQDEEKGWLCRLM